MKKCVRIFKAEEFWPSVWSVVNLAGHLWSPWKGTSGNHVESTAFTSSNCLWSWCWFKQHLQVYLFIFYKVEWIRNYICLMQIKFIEDWSKLNQIYLRTNLKRFGPTFIFKALIVPSLFFSRCLFIGILQNNRWLNRMKSFDNICTSTRTDHYYCS